MRLRDWNKLDCHQVPEVDRTLFWCLRMCICQSLRRSLR